MLDWVLNKPLKMLKSSIPVDTGHKLNVYKALRRRPGRLLNVLYTFKQIIVIVTTCSGSC